MRLGFLRLWLVIRVEEGEAGDEDEAEDDEEQGPPAIDEGVFLVCAHLVLRFN
jgi:hypothetical protein